MPYIWFDTRTDRCNIPVELLTEGEKALLERKGLKAKDDRFGPCYRDVIIRHFPSIFYNQRTTKINDVDIPRYVHAFLREPSLSRCTFYGYYLDNGREATEELVKLAELFQKDFEEFPLELFYEHLFKLRGIEIAYDDGNDEDYAVAKFDTRKVILGNKSRAHLFDFGYVAVTLLHELYHFVEVDMDDSVAELWEPRWHFVRGKVFNGSWEPEKFKNIPSEHLAEVLAALTYIRRPEIIEELRPYYNALNETVNPQLFLFARSKSVWFEK